MFSLTFFSLVICSVILACKYNEDELFEDSVYSLLGGIPPAEYVRLERAFLSSVSFELAVTHEEYARYLEMLSDFAEGGRLM